MDAVPAADQQGSVEADKAPAASPMMQVEGFFMALTSSNADGRVVLNNQGIVLEAHVKINPSKSPLILKQKLCVFICRNVVGEQR